MNQAQHPIKASAKAADAELVELGHYLKKMGYSFTAVTPLTHQYNNQRLTSPTANSLRDIFGWSRPFDAALVTSVPFELMQRAGILVQQDTLWYSKLRWSSLGNILCAHSAYPTDAQDAVFFGPDTYRFARFIEPWLQAHHNTVRRAVDIGCGSGAGALLIATACPDAEVLAVDINPQALRLTAVNAKLAEVANVEPRYSNLLDDVAGQFDLIIANPPYMLDAQERDYRHGGGALGEALSARIVEAALSRLAPGGSLLLYTGVAIVGGKDPFLESLEQQLSGYNGSWHYSEIDPDVFAEELLKPAYKQVERIAAVQLTVKAASGKSPV